MAFDSVEGVLDFAIGEEEKAAMFYTELAGKMDKPWMKQVFESFAQEEVGHKHKLLGVKEGKFLLPAAAKVTDLKIGDYLIDVEPTPEMEYQDALIVAMKAEKAAFRLYSDIAGTTDNADLRGTFEALAQEEAKHKLRFEIEYDDRVLREN
ncbi:MAG: rubrerythrin [Armatimonadetes bacterium CG_4_10_14_3_um_filter_66_18]|nr:ferritin family protein [Armatimonadota bacterium]OIP09559.1 MAG: rubrerythrin [Armatimonadetes bacterium CG2_30_66_41]PIU89005.1 MAG: rubrerythrin [Armatimonadetes bacterium CG06_land_8_20_14_3_00_66_21]PIX37083.1 MAG: rubrerythrin [Armatimonadetes bacterium CG_4_8_14_3_um_filter_66_20]PIY48927.1 MAG: rubrerythrin [Armatimonadetes bacterium CG_4_10_14_3_um_filter_66_18]PIZ34835.1 MAG: rubrerythrin [Armatimonadetes bacterium CG_4_10_14_0_8_um_filter_66_14]PJB70330.1 MAG: rubrerythrin [Arma